MPNRRKLFQISLITLGLIIVFLTYFTNLERNQQEDFKVSENTSDDERFLEEGVNRFENVEYQGIDNSGNKFVIGSSPARLLVFDAYTQKFEKEIVLESDIRHAIHGLEIIDEL